MKSQFTTRTTFREKLERDQPAKVVTIPPSMTKRHGTGTMLIPKPLDVDALIRTVPKGRLVTQSAIRARLAKDCKADVTCPIVTGMFVRIAAEAAEEDLRNGKKKITPYWRVIRDDGSLIAKFPGGEKVQAKRLRDEGHLVKQQGKKWKVVGFEHDLTIL